MRTALILTTLVAVLITVSAFTFRRIYWRHQRARLTQWSSQLERLPHKCEGIDFTRNGKTVSVTTAFVELDKGGECWSYDGDNPDPRRFYVVPPGIWVDTIEEILDEWDKATK